LDEGELGGPHGGQRRHRQALHPPPPAKAPCSRRAAASRSGWASSAEITASPSAPASTTERAFSPVIPPIATSGRRVRSRARRTASSATSGSGAALLRVGNTGPIAT